MSELHDAPMHNAAGDVDQHDQESAPAGVLAGFSEQETARLITARERFQHGNLHEWTSDFQRMRFARWLYENGYLES